MEVLAWVSVGVLVSSMFLTDSLKYATAGAIMIIFFIATY